MLSPSLLLLFLMGCFPLWAQSQQLLPIIRQSASSSQLTQSAATFNVTHHDGLSYVKLQDVSSALGGQLRWRSAAKVVEFSLQGQRIRFGWNSRYATVNGDRVRLEGPTLKWSDGFWVPTSFFAGDTFFKTTRARLSVPSPVARHSSPVTPLPSPVSPTPAAVAAPHPSPVTHQTATRAIRRIVIDPGHGGKDPGTVSPHGIQEKDINLQLALELADRLREDRDYEVLLTRMDDSFIPLAQRTRLANQTNADLFISLHCNASLSPKLKGFEVYFLSEDASDPHADAVARTENAALALEGDGVVPPTKLNALLRSLVRNAKINESSAMGSLVDKQVSKRLSEPSLGVKQAGFFVLRGAEMPAILIEAGFLTHPREERLLQDPHFRSRLTQGVVAAVDAYDQRKQQERGSEPKT